MGARMSPLLLRDTVAAAVARAIEHYPGMDLEGTFAAVSFVPPTMKHQAAEVVGERCMNGHAQAHKGDRAVMGWHECMREAGATPAERIDPDAMRRRAGEATLPRGVVRTIAGRRVSL